MAVLRRRSIKWYFEASIKINQIFQIRLVQLVVLNGGFSIVLCQDRLSIAALESKVDSSSDDLRSIHLLRLNMTIDRQLPVQFLLSKNSYLSSGD